MELQGLKNEANVDVTNLHSTVRPAEGDNSGCKKTEYMAVYGEKDIEFIQKVFQKQFGVKITSKSKLI